MICLKIYQARISIKKDLDGGRMQSAQRNTEWIKFYEEFADALLEFRSNREDLIGVIEKVFTKAGLKLPKLEAKNPPADIDPFTVIGLFNKGITDKNRKLIMRAFADEFEMTSPVPDSFDGVPVLNNLNATFYRFSDDETRGSKDIENLWCLFAAAINYADSKTEKSRDEFSAAFDEVKDLKGNRWKLTMGLYWIRPYSFLNLDSRNRWFISEMSGLPEDVAKSVKGLHEVPSACDYLSISNRISESMAGGSYCFSDFPSLSHEAWIVSEKVNKENRKSACDDVATDEVLADVRGTHYWLYSPGTGAYLWDELRERGEMAIGWEEIGDLSAYDSKESMKQAMKEMIDPSKPFKNAAHATWQFVNEMKPGDVVYAKKGMFELVGRGIVTSDYRYDPSLGKDRSNVRSVEWTHAGTWEHPGQAAMKTLTDVTPYKDYVEKLEAIFSSEQTEEEEPESSYPVYTKDEFLNDVFMNEDDYDELAFLVRTKKNVILQGAPGVGKTYCAKRLAYSLMGQKDSSRVMMVQFHQSYSYEDFIEGYRPSGGGFELRKGPFYRFCKKAEVDSDNEYFFIIDEINRGNLSKIFGELFMLIEADKRGVGLNLLYSDEEFSVPKNVRIIGMMNTADRSLAMLDYALRRRFAFFDIRPGFDSDGFKAYLDDLDSDQFASLVSTVKQLNVEISEDDTLGEGFCIGHSYFCGIPAGKADSARLAAIVNYELVPLLREYWYDEPAKVKEWAQRLRSAAN